MKKFFAIVLSIFITTNVYSDSISNNISGYIGNLIPGTGDTEVSIDLRENFKPDYSILGVREVEKTSNGNLFTQFSIFNTEKLALKNSF